MTEREDHPDYAYYISCGCRDVSHSLGFAKIPEPWALMFDADEMYYFGFNKKTGAETSATWDKWAIYRGTKRDMEQEGLGVSDIGEINRRIKSAAADIVHGRKGATHNVISLINARMEMLKAREFKEQHRNEDAE